jgi:hypothetical protein
MLVRGFIHRQRNRYRREALAEYARHEEALRDPTRRATALAALAELMKRTAVTAYPREDVASLTGAEWTAFLDRTGRDSAFTQGGGVALEEVSYDGSAASGIDDAKAGELARLVRDWLTHHQTQTGMGGAS